MGQMFTCGCCGGECQEQGEGNDIGFGTCESCEEWIGDMTDAQLDRIADKIEAALKPENAAKFKAMDQDARRAVALRMALRVGK